MFGVVLWSDSADRKAVIWCEDHGELAYYRQSAPGERVAFDVGDWVQFDVTMESHMRYAHNPRLVAEGMFDGLPQSLTGASEAGAERAVVRPIPTPPGAEVIRFSLDRKRGKKNMVTNTDWACNRA